MKLVNKFTLLTALVATPVIAQEAAPKDHPGKAIYQTCSACHQATGLGLANVFPPIAESEWVNGPAENLIRIQLRGLMGKITVKGKEYNSVMPPNATMTDQQIADVLTYIRSNFGNKAEAVTPAQVTALRGEVGKPMLTVKDLKDPEKAAAEEKKKEPAKEETKKEETKAEPKKEETKEKE